MQGIRLIFVGKTDAKEIAALSADYLKRINRFIPIEVVELPDIKARKSLSMDEQKRREGEMILETIGNLDDAVLLDERGKELTSRAYAEWFEHKMQVVPRRLCLVIGGPYGFSDEVYARCRERLSLSKMTFSHQMVRLFLIEQIYRALSIIHGHPYHHD
ncbi:23S rRNA (pseudouridine(1915)-N(3))-methyltransferase RlmH [Porphyromonas sp.]|uniref:23S rRNA (pseudouridine(1915)-N(3))-methyltransferase RlmH n=1 Tax=Porphyromonas sp. TaxID=1924944 RepID=UPI0026DD067D|nr:23S rRNA (pseudouridine(1915)-N(3))-methyltransferase RlmH [Porphyromonas sp.]MDO4770803.1 23S rRNA (pseudouridine(1915)-N(3))-methyltransferase RlmH [Porphyromonas sp.]